MASNGETSENVCNSQTLSADSNANPNTDTVPKLKVNQAPATNSRMDNNNDQHTKSKNFTPVSNGCKSASVNGMRNGFCAGPSTSRMRESESECSSDTGNDDLSCSDDCCIYTYKGDVADLPTGFLRLNVDANEQEKSRAGSRGSSPEMDYLEMDFDPGPSCDADSDESSVTSDLKSEENLLQNGFEVEEIGVEQSEASGVEAVKDERSEENNLSGDAAGVVEKNEQETRNMDQKEKICLTKNVQDELLLANKNDIAVTIIEPKPSTSFHQDPWIPKASTERTLTALVLRESTGCHRNSGDLISPSDHPCTPNTSASLYHVAMEKQFVLDTKQAAVRRECVEKTMVWSEQEAAVNQVTQISTSACGATAVLNVMQALGWPTPTTEQLVACVCTRLRANSSPIVPYLKSRSVAGCTHKDIIRGLSKLTDGNIYARFFHMYPERYINLSQWLAYWIRQGAVPVATLNLQKGLKPGNLIPDAWHHQMLFGVGPEGIYLTNPLECVEEGVLWHQLSSESVLLVKREDVVSRWTYRTNLKELMHIKDVRWHNLNVLGQVANVIREHHCLINPQAVSRTHIAIPASYYAGITLAMNASNPACALLEQSPDLPTLNALP